jgi:hypothetical protein
MKVYLIFSDPYETICWGVFSSREEALRKAAEVDDSSVWVEERTMDVLDWDQTGYWKVKGRSYE